MHKYRLICGPNGELVKKTVDLAKGRSLQHAGIAMHVLADTWAHSYFAGTPSLVINNTNDEFYELINENGKEIERKLYVKQNYTLEAEQLSRCIENGETPHISPEFSIKNARLLDEIFDKIGY